MENIFKYYDFSEFFLDVSDVFSGNYICFSELNEQHFLVFERNDKDNVVSYFNLYVLKYNSIDEIGVKKPVIKELLAEKYDKSLPEHRIILRKYLY